MLTKRFATGSLGLLMVLALALVFMNGCDSASSSSDGGGGASGPQITLSLAQSTLGLGQTVLVEATVTNDGSAVSGTSVSFSANPSSSGSFSQATVSTGGDGSAATVFNPSETGYIAISASAEVSGEVVNASANLQVSEEQQVGTGNITVEATPGLLTADGNDVSVITVTVRDGAGNTAPDNTVIVLTAGERFVDRDGNGVWSPGQDSLIFDANANGTWDAIGTIASNVAVSGGAGQATVNYVSGSQAATVYVKATVLDGQYAGTSEISLQLVPDASIYSIFLSSDSVSLSVRATGGVETSWLRAACYDIWGNPVPAGLVVSFSILDSPGGGEFLGADSGVTVVQAVTNSQGVASTTIHSGTASGTVRIRAATTDVLSNATQVLISAGPPFDIAVGVEECNVQWWNIVGEDLGVVAVVSDIYNNPVNDSTVVYFTCDEGVVKSHEARTMFQNGKASSLWTPASEIGDDGDVWVYAETAGGTVRDSTMFFNTWVADTLIVTGVPATIPADGKSKVVVFVQGFDLNMNPLIKGTVVHSDANFLKPEGATLEDGCYGAVDRVKITSSTLDADYSTVYPGAGTDDGIGATDVVYYWSGVALTSFTVQLTTGSAYSGNSSLNTETGTVAPGQTATFVATIADRFGNPLGDHTLVMTATGGTVTGGTQSTNPYGEAGGFQWTAPVTDGDYTITVQDTDPRGGIYLTTTVTVETPT